MKDEYGSPSAPPVSCRQVPKQQEKEECTQVDMPDNLAKHQYTFFAQVPREECVQVPRQVPVQVPEQVSCTCTE